MSHQIKFESFILDKYTGEEIEVNVEADYTPGDPGCHTMRNGDPGWPPSDPECEITRVSYYCEVAQRTIEVNIPALDDDAIERLVTEALGTIQDDESYFDDWVQELEEREQP